MLTLFFLTGLFEDLPEATLGAVVIAAVIDLVDVDALRRLHHINSLSRMYGPAARPDFYAAVAAMLGVLVFDLLPGLFIGIAVSLLLLLYRAAKPNIARLGRIPGTHRYVDNQRFDDLEPTDGVVVLRVESGLFFANSEAVRNSIRSASAEPGVFGVVIDAETVPYIDVTAVEMLAGISEELGERGVGLAMARNVEQIQEVLKTAGAPPALRHLYTTVDAAVKGLRKDHAESRGRPEAAGGAR